MGVAYRRCNITIYMLSIYLSFNLFIYLSIYLSRCCGGDKFDTGYQDWRSATIGKHTSIKKKFKILIVFKRWMPASKRCFFPTLTIFFLCCKLTSLLYKEIWGYSLCFWFVHRIQFKIGNATLCIKRGHLKLHRRPLSAKAIKNKWLNV